MQPSTLLVGLLAIGATLAACGDTEVDADGDGFIPPEDCNDEHPAVHPDAIEDCADGVDNDCDGLLNCEDGDCIGSRACNEICDNGSDDDVDGFVDCVDSDCTGQPACAEAVRVVSGSLDYSRVNRIRRAWGRTTGGPQINWLFSDLVLSYRFGEGTTFGTCQWGADRLLLEHQNGAASGLTTWDLEIEVSGSWSDGCPEGKPRLDFSLGETEAGDGTFTACHGRPIWGTHSWATYYDEEENCSTNGWLRGSSSGFASWVSTFVSPGTSSGSARYETTFFTYANVPVLETGPWAYEE